MPPTFVTLFGTIWLTQSWRVVQHETDLQTSQAKRNSQVTNKTTIVLKVIQDPGRILQLLQTWETKSFIKQQ